MYVNVLVGGLFNHQVQGNYIMGRQVADEALKKLALEKSKNGDGDLMVELEEEDVETDKLPEQLDPNEPLHVQAHELLGSKGGFNFSLLTREMDGDANIKSEVDEMKAKFMPVLEKLKESDLLVQANKKWFYKTKRTTV